MKLALIFLVFSLTTVAQNMPKPVPRLAGVSQTENNGYALIAYEIEITNRDRFANQLFSAAPDLPPCGRNTASSRTWINIYDEEGARFYGWCAVRTNGELASLRFARPAANIQPTHVVIEFVDRLTGKITRSDWLPVSQP